jgi:hypothetical protein
VSKAAILGAVKTLDLAAARRLLETRASRKRDKRFVEALHAHQQ